MNATTINKILKQLDNIDKAVNKLRVILPVPEFKYSPVKKRKRRAKNSAQLLLRKMDAALSSAIKQGIYLKD